MELYTQVIEGRFLSRPNRFIALVETESGVETCHVKNTGRCRELLVPGCRVILSVSDGMNRKTRCDLVAVWKGERLINMDSQAPNKAALEALPWLFPGVKSIRPETVFGDSRLDFYLETEKERIFLEVKGVTLEENGVCLFPDAPTERGVKHLRELEKCVEAGYIAAIFFVIQMEGVRYFTPNEKTHPAFARTLKSVRDQGVRLMAYDCAVFPTGMEIKTPVEIRLG